MAAARQPGSQPSSPRTTALFSLEREARQLADHLPDLAVEASRVAVTVAHGIHGRRRAGPGETFWQFRQYQAADAAQMIDWRRSASSDHIYVREREWEAAHTIWLWPDLSASMDFRSHLSNVSKRERAIVLALAAADLLVRGGERVGLLGLSAPTASRNAATRMAEALSSHWNTPLLSASQPPKIRLSRFSGAILVGDFLDPVDVTRQHVEALAGHGVDGHLIQVMDPAEETLPYKGRTEFIGVEGDERWLADRVDTLRPLYERRLAAHRAELADMAHKFGWTFLVHHTDRPASEPLLTLLVQLHARGSDYRASGSGRNEPSAGVTG